MHFVSTSDLSWMFSPPVLWFLEDNSCSVFMVDDRKIKKGLGWVTHLLWFDEAHEGLI